MKLGFIGTGRIATAVIKGFCSSSIKNTTISLSPRSKSNSIYLARTFPKVKRLKSNQLVLDNSDIIFVEFSFVLKVWFKYFNQSNRY